MSPKASRVQVDSHGRVAGWVISTSGKVEGAWCGVGLDCQVCQT